MKDLITTLQEITQGLEPQSFREVALAAQELLAKQVRQSWALHQDPNENAWAGLKQPSFAGVLKASHQHLLGYKETGKHAFYGQDDLSGNQSQSFLGLKALKSIREGTVSDNGFATSGNLPRYWEWQNDGTTKTGWGGPIPAREFWAWGNDVLDVVQSLLGDRAIAIVQEGK